MQWRLVPIYLLLSEKQHTCSRWVVLCVESGLSNSFRNTTKGTLSTESRDKSANTPSATFSLPLYDFESRYPMLGNPDKIEESK